MTIPITVATGVPFRDVKRSDERFTAVKYVYEHGIFEGTSATTFEPETVMTRGMLVTVLWRMEGKPAAAERAAFADVLPDDWYADAVAWAAEAGIVKGYGPDAFGPEDDLTREQILTILHRWAGEPVPAEDAPRLADESGVDDWALDAVRWTYAAAIAAESEITGAAAQAPMPRADVAEVLMRYELFTKDDGD